MISQVREMITNHGYVLLMFLKKLGWERDGRKRSKKIKGGKGGRRKERRDRMCFKILPTLFFPDFSNHELSLHPLNFARALIIRNVHLAILYFPLRCFNGLLFTQLVYVLILELSCKFLQDREHILFIFVFSIVCNTMP